MTKVIIMLFDISDPKDLGEMQRLKSNPQKYKILVDETVNLPYRHIEYEIMDKNSLQSPDHV